jgi:hypothetical protein
MSSEQRISDCQTLLAAKTKKKGHRTELIHNTYICLPHETATSEIKYSYSFSHEDCGVSSGCVMIRLLKRETGGSLIR